MLETNDNFDRFDNDLAQEIFVLRRDRAQVVADLMKEYDDKLNKKIKELQGICSHSLTRPIEVLWASDPSKECIYCGRRVW